MTYVTYISKVTLIDYEIKRGCVKMAQPLFCNLL